MNADCPSQEWKKFREKLGTRKKWRARIYHIYALTAHSQIQVIYVCHGRLIFFAFFSRRGLSFDLTPVRKNVAGGETRWSNVTLVIEFFVQQQQCLVFAHTSLAVSFLGGLCKIHVVRSDTLPITGPVVKHTTCTAQGCT